MYYMAAKVPKSFLEVLTGHEKILELKKIVADRKIKGKRKEKIDIYKRSRERNEKEMKHATNCRSHYTQTAIHTNCNYHFTQTAVFTTHKLQFSLHTNCSSHYTRCKVKTKRL